MPRTAGSVGMADAGREHHMVPAGLEAETGLVDIDQAVVDEGDIQAVQSLVEVDNNHTAAADEEAVQEGLDNIHSLAGGPAPAEGAVPDRNMVDGDSSFSRGS